MLARSGLAFLRLWVLVVVWAAGRWGVCAVVLGQWARRLECLGRQRDRDTETQGDRETRDDRETERERERDKDRERERERDTDRERERGA